MSDLHVGIIMDGNGRWAASRGMPRWRGHVAGVDSVREVVRAAPGLGIGTLTLYAFSSDNWKRPQTEVGRLFWLLQDYCRREAGELAQSGVRVTHIGRTDRVPPGARAALANVQAATAHGSRLHLRLAIDYGAQQAITGAVREMVRRASEGLLQPEEIDAALVGTLVTDGVPGADLIVRTAGEQRLSDFLLWEAAYAELVFTDLAWPEFRAPDLARTVAEFLGRERRFGGLPGEPDPARAAAIAPA